MNLTDWLAKGWLVKHNPDRWRRGFCSYLATPGGFEPPISTVTGWHVRPLHHGALKDNWLITKY
jgi:hypothetical protein